MRRAELDETMAGPALSAAVGSNPARRAAARAMRGGRVAF